MSERRFPIMRPDRGSKTLPAPVRSIPWSVAERAYVAYSQRFGAELSLERIAERGGFDAGEMDIFAPGWRDEVTEIADLRAQLAAAEARATAATERAERAEALLRKDREVDATTMNMPCDAAARERGTGKNVTYERGRADGRRGHPPAELTAEYLRGYNEASK